MKRKFDVKIRKVGNSYVATIPKDTIDRFELKEGDYIALNFDSSDIKKSLNKSESLDKSKTQGFFDIKKLNEKKLNEKKLNDKSENKNPK